MVIYSVSVRIKNEFEEEWLNWMKENHIPAVLSTKHFTNCEVFRVLIPEIEESVVMYKMKYYCETFENYLDYQKNDAARLQADHNDKFQGKFTASREVMENISNIR
jgi:hypothetical protein